MMIRLSWIRYVPEGLYVYISEKGRGKGSYNMIKNERLIKMIDAQLEKVYSLCYCAYAVRDLEKSKIYTYSNQTAEQLKNRLECTQLLGWGEQLELANKIRVALLGCAFSPKQQNKAFQLGKPAWVNEWERRDEKGIQAYKISTDKSKIMNNGHILLKDWLNVARNRKYVAVDLIDLYFVAYTNDPQDLFNILNVIADKEIKEDFYTLKNENMKPEHYDRIELAKEWQQKYIDRWNIRYANRQLFSLLYKDSFGRLQTTEDFKNILNSTFLFGMTPPVSLAFKEYTKLTVIEKEVLKKINEHNALITALYLNKKKRQEYDIKKILTYINLKAQSKPMTHSIKKYTKELSFLTYKS